MRRQDRQAGARFGAVARDGTQIARPQKDGSLRVLLPPFRRKDFDWHKPVLVEPEIQWNGATGITNWEWARRTTPAHQVAVLKPLGEMLKASPPEVAPVDLWARVDAARGAVDGTLPNGLPGNDLGGDLLEKLRSYVTEAFSPDGQWRVLVQAVHLSEHLIADRIDVRHCDYRTLPDWTLMKRVRAFVLDDDRDCWLYLPGVDPTRKGWEHRYENSTPNNLSMIAPRWDAVETDQPKEASNG